MAKAKLKAVQGKGNDLFLLALKEQDYLVYQYQERKRWSVEDWRRHLIKQQGRNTWVSFPIALQNCDAYFKLSSNAKVILARCFCESKAPRNKEGKVGKFTGTSGYSEFYLPYNLLRAVGIRNDTSIAKAFKELKALGFLEQVGEYKRGYPNRYKLSDDYKKSHLSATK